MQAGIFVPLQISIGTFVPAKRQYAVGLLMTGIAGIITS